MSAEVLSCEDIQKYVWSKKYKDDTDSSFQDMVLRVARAAASAEAESCRDKWEAEFVKLMYFFLPGGRILNSLGTNKRRTTPFNCSASGVIEDDMNSIFSVLHEAAITMQAGGGVGFDFSNLRPEGAEVKGVGSTASGPISFMQTYNAMCETISSSGHRRGAMIGLLRIDHPDIEKFITAKRGEDNKALQNFNLSILVTDAFMDAVRKGAEWNLVFDGKVWKTLPAKDLWNQIMQNNYDYAEPGIIFIDRVNKLNNLYYAETISACNPCGEQPLPPHGVCNLGSINLTRFVSDPFTPNASFDFEALQAIVPVAIRFLDDVIDIAKLPLKQQEEEVRNKRRIGLGVTGVGDAIWMLGMQYGDESSINFIEKLAQAIRDTAYMASSEIAAEKGSFPLFDAEKYLSGKFVSALPEYIREAIRTNGIRNSHLLTIAPTGTTSLMWGNVSSGVEPIFSLTVKRKIKEGEGKEREVIIEDYAYSLYKKNGNGSSGEPDVAVSSKVSAKRHIDVMATFQKYVDASISKTIVFDPNTSFEEFADTYIYAYDAGLKGCTVYRESGKIASVIKSTTPGQQYIIPEGLPDYRIKHSFKVDTPEGGMYVDVTEVNGAPKEVWVVTPVEAERPEDLDAICKLASICLRANIHPEEVLKQITTSIRKYGHVSSMLAFIERGMRRGFAKILGEKNLVVGKPCPICGQPLVYRDGCVKCSSCDYDKCG